jgi:ABC-type Fe3+-hydroxamate transport system substrate-binding protein
MHEVKDQLGRSLTLSEEPKRIISLVPSLTELLYSLGLKDRIIGRTRFCIHPSHSVENAEIIGGTKNFSVERIQELHPDLIIANKEENDRDKILELSAKFPVWVSDVANLYDAIDMIHGIGHITGTGNKAHLIAETVLESFSNLKHVNRYSALYFIWRKPWMVAGRNTFIHDIMHRAGMMNEVTLDRYPVIEPDKLANFDPDIIFLSSEPFPFKEKHRIEMEKLFPRAKVLLVNGEYFSWYGSRLLGSADYLQSIVGAISAPASVRSSQKSG